MAGIPAGLPAGVRLSDHISLGVIARAVPPERVRQVLLETGKASERERDLPAGAGDGLLCHCPGALHGVEHARGTALPAGGAALAVGRRGGPGGGPRAASRKRAVVWAKRRCAGSMRKWCAPLLPAPARERGIETGDWSAWTGPAWRWPTPWRTGANLACPGQPRCERFPATAFRGAGGEWHARAVRRPSRALCHR